MISFFEIWVSVKYLLPKTREKFLSVITIFSFPDLIVRVWAFWSFVVRSWIFQNPFESDFVVIFWDHDGCSWTFDNGKDWPQNVTVVSLCNTIPSENNAGKWRLVGGLLHVIKKKVIDSEG